MRHADHRVALNIYIQLVVNDRQTAPEMHIFPRAIISSKDHVLLFKKIIFQHSAIYGSCGPLVRQATVAEKNHRIALILCV